MMVRLLMRVLMYYCADCRKTIKAKKKLHQRFANNEKKGDAKDNKKGEVVL